MERVNSHEGDLKNKVAIVTGGSSGIGKAIAKEFILEGARVMIFDVNNPDEDLNNIIDHIQSVFFKGDLRDSEAIHRLVVETEEKLGPISLLVNNAAIDPKDAFALTVTDDVWNQVMDINVNGARYLTQIAGSRMIIHKQGGSIIFISSLQTALPLTGDNPYITSKHAIEGYMASLAAEWAQYGIRSNAIAPGVIADTGMSSLTEEEIKDFGQKIPLGRVGYPQDIATWAAFLASEKSSFATGQVFRVDGGSSIKNFLR